jgi:hypothetical protein
MEAKPAVLMLLPSPVVHQEPKKLKMAILCTTPGCKMNLDHQPVYHHQPHLSVLTFLSLIPSVSSTIQSHILLSRFTCL